MGLQQHWSKTADNNDDADASINLRENQSPSTYNNAVRAAMAAVKRSFDDINGSLVTGGSSTAYTVTTNEGFTALADGMTIRARLHTASGAAPTLDVDGRGAVAIQIAVGSAPASGALLATTYDFTYYAAGPAWLAGGLSAIDVGTAVARPFAAGVTQFFCNNTAPTGWVKDTSVDGASIRLASGNVGDGGSLDFDTCFSSSRTIAQANLPSFNLAFSLTASNVLGGLMVRNTAGAFGVQHIAPTSVTEVLTPQNLTIADISTYSVGGTIHSGGSGTGLNFQVKYAKAIRATIS